MPAIRSNQAPVHETIKPRLTTSSCSKAKLREAAKEIDEYCEYLRSLQRDYKEYTYSYMTLGGDFDQTFPLRSITFHDLHLNLGVHLAKAAEDGFQMSFHDDLVFSGTRSATIKWMFQWPGCEPQSCDLSIFDEQGNPITRQTLVQKIAQILVPYIKAGKHEHKRYLRKHKKIMPYATPIPEHISRNWGIRCVNYREVKLLSLDYMGDFWRLVVFMDESQ